MGGTLNRTDARAGESLCKICYRQIGFMAELMAELPPTEEQSTCGAAEFGKRPVTAGPYTPRSRLRPRQQI